MPDTNSINTTNPSSSPSPSPSFFKRKLTSHRRKSSSTTSSSSLLPSVLADLKLHKFFNTSSSSNSSIYNGDSIAPPHHRENTPLHALKDTIPHLHLHAPSFPFSTTIPNALPNLFCLNSEPVSEDEEGERKEKEVENDPLKRLEGNVVVLGGYRGSILRDKAGKRLWIPLRVGFGLRKANLALGLSDSDELNSEDTVIPGKMLMAVSGFIDLGKRLKDKLKSLEHESSGSENGLKFHSWGYDWRRRLELSSAELILYLEKLKEEGNGQGATVIAHSMGGLVALHALATSQDPTIFKGLIFAGCPFQGCVNVLEPFRRGDGVLFNREICSPNVVFSMRSSFYFLPSPLACFESPTGEPLPIDFSSPQTWSDYSLSPCSGAILEPTSNEKDEIRFKNRKEAERAEEIGLAPLVGGEGVPSRRREVLETDTPEPERDGSEDVSRSNSVKDGSGNGMERNVINGGEVLGEESDEVVADYLVRTLGRVEQFYATIRNSYSSDKAHLYPPMCILSSQKTPTVRGVITDSYETIKGGDYSQLLFDKGDGIVSYVSATELPGGKDKWMKHVVGIEESSHGHVSLLGDLSTVRKCLEKLYPVEEKEGS